MVLKLLTHIAYANELGMTLKKTKRVVSNVIILTIIERLTEQLFRLMHIKRNSKVKSNQTKIVEMPLSSSCIWHYQMSKGVFSIYTAMMVGLSGRVVGLVV